jgi:subtilisin family serine protease
VTSINPLGTVPGWANYGRTGVSVAAPGISILSTYPGTGTAFENGTSMSTPHVSGIAVLLWAREPSLKPSDVKGRIISTAEPVLDLASRSASAGRANAYNALTSRVPPPAAPAIRFVSSSKKVLTIDGLGILGGSSVIQVNGVTIDGRYDYDEAFKLSNGSFTRLTVKLSKSKMKEILPLGQAGLVNLYNQATGERSSVVSHTRD